MVYRKNRTRHYLSGNDEDFQFTPQTETEIANLIQAANTDLLAHFNKSCWATWEAVNVNFLSDYVKPDPNGNGTITISFDTPGSLQEEYEQLLQAEEKLLNETALFQHRHGIGFIWYRNYITIKFNQSKTKVQEWVN